MKEVESNLASTKIPKKNDSSSSNNSEVEKLEKRKGLKFYPSATDTKEKDSYKSTTKYDVPQEAKKNTFTSKYNSSYYTKTENENTGPDPEAKKKFSTRFDNTYYKPKEVEKVVKLEADSIKLENLINMGFEEERCKKALIISSNNLEHATELLLGGSDFELFDQFNTGSVPYYGGYQPYNYRGYNLPSNIPDSKEDKITEIKQSKYIHYILN